jgi:hypothetical protein
MRDSVLTSSSRCEPQASLGGRTAEPRYRFLTNTVPAE